MGNAVVKTLIRRRDAAHGNRSGRRLPTAFLRELRRHDRDLELHWFDSIGKWVVYRAKTHGAIPGDDILIKEFVLAGPRGERREPGSWLLDWLRVNDKTRGGSIDPISANRAWLKKLDDEEKREEESRRKWKREFSEDIAKQMLTYAVDQRKTYDMKRPGGRNGTTPDS